VKDEEGRKWDEEKKERSETRKRWIFDELKKRRRI